MTKELTTQFSTLEARNENLPTVSRPFVFEGLDLMPPDDGSLARLVYDSAVDKNNPPVEEVVQYLFKNGYRRVGAVSEFVRLDTEKRYDEMARLISPPNKDYELFLQVRAQAMGEFRDQAMEIHLMTPPLLRKSVKEYFQSLQLDYPTNFDSWDKPNGQWKETSLPETLLTLAQGLSISQPAHRSLLTLDLFLRECQGQNVDAFAFIERAAPKGLTMEYARFDVGDLGSKVNTLLSRGEFDTDHARNQYLHPYGQGIISQAQQRYSTIYGGFTGMGVLAGAIGLMVGAPYIALVGECILVSAATAFCMDRAGTTRPQRIENAVKRHTPFPCLSDTAKHNYSEIYKLQAADGIVPQLTG